jgi:hypothetical protein
MRVPVAAKIALVNAGRTGIDNLGEIASMREIESESLGSAGLPGP